jgi:hypothetical protein
LVSFSNFFERCSIAFSFWFQEHFCSLKTKIRLFFQKVKLFCQKNIFLTNKDFLVFLKNIPIRGDSQIALPPPAGGMEAETASHPRARPTTWGAEGHKKGREEYKKSVCKMPHTCFFDTKRGVSPCGTFFLG